MSTEFRGQRLETLRIPRTTGQGIGIVAPAALTERFAQLARRDAFVALFVGAKRKPDAIYDLQQGKTKLPDERQRELIHEGIRAGYITREQVVNYRLAQTADDLAQFPTGYTPQEAIFVQCVTEFAEAMEKITLAATLPTETNVTNAIRETREALLVGELHVAALSQRIGA